MPGTPQSLHRILVAFLVPVLWISLGCAQEGKPATGIAGACKSAPLTRSGLQHYYDLEYAQAISDFEKAQAAHPEDPFATNHLLAAVFFRELYQAGALETGPYSNNSFLDKKKVRLDPAADSRVHALIRQAREQADKLIAKNANDVEALYARGVTEGMAATYTGLVDKSWFKALGDAKAARHDHERVLELDPRYSDAKLTVGIHNYIVGSLPWPMRILAHVVGEGGDKHKGIQYLYDASNGGGEAYLDAKVVLALFLRREQRFPEAVKVDKSLTEAHPRNFLFALEEANVLKDAGHGTESIAAYRGVIAAAEEKRYADPHMEYVYFGLGEALRGQRHFEESAAAYQQVLTVTRAEQEIKQRASVYAGEMMDAAGHREQAINLYQPVAESQADNPWVSLARRRMKQPYRPPE